MLRTRWHPGPVAWTAKEGANADGVLVNVTEFTADRVRDLPGIVRAGLRLRREWPRLHGAIGVWLWADPARRRCGSVTVWTDEAALRGFVALPAHRSIVRQYRDRGTMRSTSWRAMTFDPPHAWREALRLLAEGSHLGLS